MDVHTTLLSLGLLSFTGSLSLRAKCDVTRTDGPSTDSRGHSQRFTRRQDVTRAVWPDQGLKPCAMAQTCDFISSCKSRLRLHHHLLQSGTPGWRGLGWLRGAVQLLHDKGWVQTVLAAFGTTMHALYAADAYICET